jgi:TatD DNase family protein
MNIELTDTHTHLYASEFDSDRDACIQRAFDAGVNRFFMPNCDSSTIDKMLALADKYPKSFYPMIGLHPCSVNENYESELLTMQKWLNQRKFYALGEIGIDLYWDKTYQKEQELVFRKQIEWSITFNLPIIIHSRSSFNEIYSILSDFKNEKLHGIFHCFSGSVDDAHKIIGLGLFLGIGGVCTFKNSGLDKVVREVDLTHIVLETDAPYLSPVPFRGKRNESSYVKIIAQSVADIKNTNIESVAFITTKNAKTIFKI